MSRKVLTLVAGALVAALVVIALVAFWPGSDTRTVNAQFPRTVSLYEGSDVKILGVPVGKVEKVTPSGTKVNVELSYDAKYKVPKDAKAVVISPSIVGDRFVQLTPVYKEGPALDDGARLGLDRTGTPLELDEIFGSLNQLNIALGPEKANKPIDGGVGPLTRLLDSTARNLGGQGAQFNQTLKDFGQLTKTLADNKEEFFGTLRQVETFTRTLARNDSTVRSFNDSLAGGADLLADEREELAAVLRNLSVAMVEIRRFVRDNRGALSSNIRGLNRISKTLVKRRGELDEILRVAPAALNNLYLAGNNKNGTLDTRDNRNVFFDQLAKNPGTAICNLVSTDKTTCTSTIGNLLNRGRTTPFGGAGSPGSTSGTDTPARVVEPVDRTLGGLVEVQR